MITELRVRDLATIADVTLPLGEGLNVLTGETGAGKSMLVDALALLLGARADAGAVRPGAARLSVEGVVEVGRSGSKYTLYVGGRTLGDRLNVELKDLVPVEQIVPTLRPLLEQFRERRLGAEGFGDFCHRVGIDRLRELVGAAGHAVTA